MERADLPQLRKWRNDALIRDWSRQNDVILEARHEAWFSGLHTNPATRVYSVISPKVDILIGSCALTSVDYENRRAEFSIYIAPEAQGKWFGGKALKTLLHHAFHTLNLNCVWGETFEGNPAAKLFEKVGMTEEGTRRAFYYRDGKFVGARLFSILRSDWDRLVSRRTQAGIPKIETPAAGDDDFEPTVSGASDGIPI